MKIKEEDHCFLKIHLCPKLPLGGLAYKLVPTQDQTEFCIIVSYLGSYCTKLATNNFH